jgi:hypothetical protein
MPAESISLEEVSIETATGPDFVADASVQELTRSE